MQLVTLSINEWWILSGILAVTMALCVKGGKLTVPGAFMGGLIGLLVYAGGSYAGLLMLGTFFILGVLATAYGKEVKATIHREGSHPQKRSAGQVLANGGVAGLLGILAMVDVDHSELYMVMMAASLASAAADTLSSELGMVHGRRFYNVLNFKREAKGLDGVVSLEGSMLGAAGAAVIAGLHALVYGFDERFVVIVVAGVAGNLADSVLGAWLERKHFMGNDVVNLLNTVVGALVGGGLVLLW
jgi:uncharacterized protein (TIGR00297 family)